MGDEDIVKLFFNRDEEALVALEARYGNYLKSIADNILHSAEDTEECVSDAYLKAWDTIRWRFIPIWRWPMGVM